MYRTSMKSYVSWASLKNSLTGRQRQHDHCHHGKQDDEREHERNDEDDEDDRSSVRRLIFSVQLAVLQQSGATRLHRKPWVGSGFSFNTLHSSSHQLINILDHCFLGLEQ